MRPGYLRQLGDPVFNWIPKYKAFPSEKEVGYIPEYLKYSRVFPNFPYEDRRAYVPYRSSRTFNILMM